MDRIKRRGINKTSIIFITAILLLLIIVLYKTRNTEVTGIEQGCYTIYSASNQIQLGPDRLQQRHCRKTYPDVIIMGAKKCGTTALRNFLSFHPQIASFKNEPHFFEKNYYLGLNWYLDQMPYATPEQLTLEKTPKYFVHPLSPRAIRTHVGPDVKFILILRDPVQRAVSDFLHVSISNARAELRREKEARKKSALLSELGVNGEEAESSLTDEQKEIRFLVKKLESKNKVPDRIGDTFEDTVLLSDGMVNKNTAIVDTGIYIKHIKRWLKVFPRNQFLVLDGEEFVYNPLSALQQVENFLNIHNFFSHENFVFDMEKRFYCLAKPIRSCMKDSKGRVHPYVEQNVLETLHNFYRPFNAELMELLTLSNFTWLP